MSSGVQDIVAGDVDADTSVERDRGREATTSAEHGRGGEAIVNPRRERRNKSMSVDAIAAWERMEALEQQRDELEGQEEELEVELVGQVGELKGSNEVVSDTMAMTYVGELGSFKARVMEAMATFEAKMRALSTFEEKWDKKRANWVLGKRAVAGGVTTSTSREVPTEEVPKSQAHNGGRRDGKPMEGKPREDMRDRFKPRTNCFLCDELHWSRDCPKRKALSAMLEEREDGDEEEVRMGSLMQVGAIQAKVDAMAPTPQGGLMGVEARLNGTSICALVDTGATHNFVSTEEAKNLGLKVSKKEEKAHLAASPGEKDEGHKEVLPRQQEKALGKCNGDTPPELPKRLPPKSKATNRHPLEEDKEQQPSGKPRADGTRRDPTTCKVATKRPQRRDVAKLQEGMATRGKKKKVGKRRRPPPLNDASGGTPMQPQVQGPRRLCTRRRAWKKQGHRKAVPRRRRDEDVASLGGGE